MALLTPVLAVEEVVKTNSVEQYSDHLVSTLMMTHLGL